MLSCARFVFIKMSMQKPKLCPFDLVVTFDLYVSDVWFVEVSAVILLLSVCIRHGLVLIDG